jgi:hypothetical protein
MALKILVLTPDGGAVDEMCYELDLETMRKNDVANN